MAIYKVIQDIEAEDKLVGPLSLRQFVYAAITIITAFIAYKLATISILLIIPFVPIIALFAVLSAPFGHDQPSEVWLLAKIRFFLKPHDRIWNQDGAINLVSITAPKTIQKQLTKNLTQTEVSSRLKALANTIDSRGWAIKNVNVNLYNQTPVTFGTVSSQRLIDPSSLPQDVPNVNVTAADDILDPESNPTAQHLEQMISASEQAHHKKVVQSITNPKIDTVKDTTLPDYWFMNEAQKPSDLPNDYTNFTNTSLIQPGDDDSKFAGANQSAADTILFNQIEQAKEHEKDKLQAAGRYLKPLSEQESQLKSQPKPSKASMTVPTNPDIINLALANKGNWSVATVANEAKQAKKKHEPPQDEVVISLR